MTSRATALRAHRDRPLHFVRIQHANGVPLRLYWASGAVCQACPAFGVCTRAREIGRSLAVGPHDAVLRRHRAWMATSAAKEAYRLRKQLVEPVFGIIKEQQMARRFLLRGLVNVAAEWTMLATAFNLRTLWRAWRSPHLHPATTQAKSPSRFLIPTAPAITLHQSIPTFNSPGKSRSVNPTGLSHLLLPATLYTTFGTGSIANFSVGGPHIMNRPCSARHPRRQTARRCGWLRPRHLSPQVGDSVDRRESMSPTRRQV